MTSRTEVLIENLKQAYEHLNTAFFISAGNSTKKNIAQIEANVLVLIDELEQENK